MTGNDVIDLTLAGKESDWKRKGFLQKVFTADERNLILSFFNPDLMVWLLWSMKESVYKISVQENLKRFLAPLKFECRPGKILENHYNGTVIYDDKEYYTESRFSSEKISTVACSDKNYPESLISCSFKFFSEDLCGRKKEMNKFFIEDFCRRINKRSEEISIVKDVFNIPHLLVKGRFLPSSVSFSHHGRYGAYAVELF